MFVLRERVCYWFELECRIQTHKINKIYTHFECATAFVCYRLDNENVEYVYKKKSGKKKYLFIY